MDYFRPATKPLHLSAFRACGRCARPVAGILATGFRAMLPLILLAAAAAPASAFELAFDWGDIPLCNSGYPNTVPSPIFTLRSVPAGTTSVTFSMVDRDAPGFDHGGGTVRYGGQSTLGPGAFTYKSPCPPGGSHTYEWTATAIDAQGKALARATARRRYP